MNDPTVLEILERLGLAALLAAALGWDREARHKAAGFRTHMLVALGAAAFTLLGIEFMDAAAETEGASNVDLTRIMQGIIGGIGFIGAGAIIQGGGRVAGMTTAAGIWVTAAIGMACGIGEYAVAGILTALALIVLTAAVWAERMIRGRDEARAE